MFLMGISASEINGSIYVFAFPVPRQVFKNLIVFEGYIYLIELDKTKHHLKLIFCCNRNRLYSIQIRKIKVYINFHYVILQCMTNSSKLPNWYENYFHNYYIEIPF